MNIPLMIKRMKNNLIFSSDYRSFIRYCRANPILSSIKTSDTVLVELHPYPNYLISLRLFIVAYQKLNPCNFVSFRESQGRRLEKVIDKVRYRFSSERAMGISDSKPVWPARLIENNSDKHQHMLSQIADNSDLEDFKYKGVLLGDLIYDDYLRNTYSETIDLNSSNFKVTFYKALNLFDKYLNLIDEYDVKAIVISNHVYNFGIIARAAFSRQIPVFCITGGTIYRLSKERPFAFVEYEDYSKAPNNSGSEEFILKSSKIRQEMVAKLFPNKIYDSKMLDSMREKNNAKKTNKGGKLKIFVALHDFFDAPHCYGGAFYPDFYLWLDALGKLSESTDYEWYLKSNPFEVGESAQVINRLKSKYPKFNTLPKHFSVEEVCDFGIDLVLTVYGTVAWEYSAVGITVINASKNHPHSKFGFSITPNSKLEYEAFLLNVDNVLTHKIIYREIEYFFYLHYMEKLQSLMYVNWSEYLYDFQKALQCGVKSEYGYYSRFQSSNRRPDQTIIKAIQQFIESRDYVMSSKHFS